MREIGWCSLTKLGGALKTKSASFKNVEELRLALHDFKKKYNEKWLLGKHKHQTPRQVFEKYIADQIAA